MEENKKGNGGVKAIVAIIIIAILAGVAYYFLRPTATPKDVFVQGIESVFESSTKKLGEDVKKINATVSLSGNIESSNEEISKIAQYINQGKITYNVQIDTEAKKLLVNLGVDYQNENLINGKVYYASGDDNIYVYVQDLYDKYFKINVNEATGSEEGLSSIDSIFNGEMTTANGKVDTKKVAEIIKETLKKNLKDEYFTKETVEGLTKNTMKLTVGELKAVVKNIFTELKENQEFLACFENQDEIKQELEDALSEIDELKTTNDNNNIEISIYTKGQKFDVEKITARVELPESNTLSMTITETEENKYEVYADVPDFGKVNLNVEVKEEANTAIEDVNTADSVDVNTMTQADQMKLLGNLSKMKIYQYLAPFMQGGF